MHHHTFIYLFSQPPSSQPSPHIPHTHTHTTMNYIFWMMKGESLRRQAIISSGEGGPCICDCENGLIHTPVSCAIISILPTPLVIGYDIIIMSCCYSRQPSVSSYMYHHPSIHLHSNPEPTNPLHTYHTTHTHNNELYLLGYDKLLSHSSGCYVSR